MLLVTRDQWGARPPENRTPLERAAQHGTAVHYSAADADEQADHARCASRVRGIQAFHLDVRGWSDIAYSYLACKHGYVFEGRGRGIRTAANGTNAGNDAYHAVCFLGDDSAGRDDVTDAGRAAIREAVDHCNGWAGVSAVRPHSWFKATGCPGDQLRGWLEAGMPTTTVPEEDTVSKQDVLDALADPVAVQRLRKALWGGTGEEIPSVSGTVNAAQTVEVAANGVRVASNKLDGVAGDLAQVIQLLRAGVTVNLNLADATPEQVLALGKAIAEHLTIQGHPTLNGTGTLQVTLEAGPPA